jgi:hypothetical protein
MDSTINQIGFLQHRMPSCCTQQRCWESAVSLHMASSGYKREPTIHLQWMLKGYPIHDVISLQESFLFMLKWYLQQIFGLQCLIAFRHWVQIK